MNRLSIHYMLLALMMTGLFLTGGTAMAQYSDGRYVIKWNDTIWNGSAIDHLEPHYLAHVNSGGTWALQDATTFDPATCVWLSSNNYNYYFLDGTTQRYLKAPLALGGSLSLGENPGTQTLNNNTLDYFFYDWDHGLARGIQHFGGDCPDSYHSSGSQCWQVVWVSFENNQWKMSSEYGYDPTPRSTRFLRETETVYTEGISGESGGVGNLTNFSMDYDDSRDLDGAASPYTYTHTSAYTHYHIDGLQDSEHHTNIPEESYYYYNSAYYTAPPTPNTYTDIAPSGYAWSLSGDGAQYLSFDEDSDLTNISGTATPTLYYRTENQTTSHKTATLTLTVSYEGGATQTRTATVTVKVACQNPTVLEDEVVVTYVGATVSWLPTAESYKVSWQKQGTSTWNQADVGNVTSYTIRGLEFEATYSYKVQATSCGALVEPPTPYPTFTTLEEPGLMITGAVFGGGRMADVGGRTRVLIVDCDSIGAVFGGNDIAGSVADSAVVILGDVGSTKVRVGDVYGGGNGYYAYNGSSFVAASEDYTSENIAVGASVRAMTQGHQVGDAVWTNEGTAPRNLSFPSIPKTSITVTNNAVKVDSLFGGAKNAFLTYDNWRHNGDSIVINGGTIFTVFGGNNWGGDQGKGKHYIEVNATKTQLTAEIENTATTGYGRDFGIRYLYGGGNKVYGSTTDVRIHGGQCDTIFGGGNAADVYAANLTVDCAFATGSNTTTYGQVYSNAITACSGTSPNYTLTFDDAYAWDGYKGIYNVRTLFGGNNQAVFDSKLNQKIPSITLTSGSIGTVYGGGNAGDVWGVSTDNGSGGWLVINDDTVKYGTHVKMNSPTILIDLLYGGCQMSDVRYSTWVELQDGHVGTVYGGCNVSGDVGSTRVRMDAPSHLGPDEPNPAYQKVFGGTYVVASGGTVHKNLFGGGNGYYHCIDPSGTYVAGLSYTNNNYVGLTSPTHNETHTVIRTGATVKGNVYAGGNLARVGFNNTTAPGDSHPYPKTVGLTSIRMTGGHVEGNVYGGGNMADVLGSCEIQVSGGTIDRSLYGGNDRLGKVAVPFSNRVLPNNYETASDGVTSLLDPKVYTYVGLTGAPKITNVYGGGNGDYAYFEDFAAAQTYTLGGGEKETVVSCDISNLPIQQCTFVDVGVDGGDPNTLGGAQIGTVYGGGDGVTVTGFITVFLNVKTNPIGYSNVGTIFGGNNKGNLLLVPDIILLNGQVNTVYGGCNQGAMSADSTITLGGVEYQHLSSLVRLRNSYPGLDANQQPTTVTPNFKVVDAIYGGCRMNDVTHNSLVFVEASHDGNYIGTKLFGGNDISGTVSGTSIVAVTGGSGVHVGNVYGGGNGDYNYTAGTYEGLTPPNSQHSRVDILGGTVHTGVYGGNNAKGNIESTAEVNILGGTIGASTSARADVYGGGYGPLTTTTGDVVVNIGATNGANPPVYSGTAVINGEVYGGSALGQVSADGYTTQVNFYKGTINGDVYGGGLGNNEHAAEVSGDVEVNIYGGTFNSATETAGGGRIFGCNNASGTPLGDVAVNIYGTDHGNTPQTNLYPAAPPTGFSTWTVPALEANTALPQAYALLDVFGGGNLAHYTPAANKSATVHVYNCNNTIQNVFGGGNAANVGTSSVNATTNVIIEGGRINRVVGGGNGDDLSKPAANIYGTANTTVYAGLIDEVYGGANIQGSVDAINLTMSNPDHSALSNCTDQTYGMVFGCANAAPFNHEVNTTVECGVGTIGQLYGGSNQNYIGDPDDHDSGAHVTLNLYGGGPFTNVFAGSKGIAAATGVEPKVADIYGDVTLNLYGGTITNAFGGSDANGNITGNITVNVLDYGGTCGLDVTNVYGASNLTPYTPDDPTTYSPVVNVIHIAQTPGIRNHVFGGGNLAAANSRSQVNIGYDASMSSLIPEGYPIAEANRRAYVSGNVFGGGNEAGTSGTMVNIFGGTVANGVYGGCNTNGTVAGNIEVNVLGGNLGSSGSPMPGGIFGGGYGNLTQTNGNVTVNIGDATHAPTLYTDVYGGSALGDVHTPNTTVDQTTVNFAKGTLHGNLYGGGLGQAGTPGISAEVNGNVVVNIGKDKNGSTVSGGVIDGYVFGANNIKGSPKGTVTVNVYDGTVTDVVGGGSVADYAAPLATPDYPYVHIAGGTVTEKVIGGGNNANITGNPRILVSGGNIGTVNSEGIGVYGGCNTNGTVTGNTTVTLTGGTLGSETLVATYHRPVNVHGGGYGQPTSVTGDVTINYGDLDANASAYPKLYGDVYGGSALGSVNTNNSNSTTVNILNGSLICYSETVHNSVTNEDQITYYSGNVFGGGLGNKASNISAMVYGKVFVNVGSVTTPPSTDLHGKATLTDCSVYGCNNQQGSPQDEVEVHVYQTAHTVTDHVEYVQNDRTYAIFQVFGGGNEAHYAPVSSTNKTHVYIHGCENTVNYVYGGGNAADAVGVSTIVQGGRFSEIYGGGNGLVVPANIGTGGIGLNVLAGNVGFLFQESNKQGTNDGGTYEPNATGFIPCSGGLFVDSYFFGTNEAVHYGDLNNSISCADAGNFEYRYVYAGSRWGKIYGDVNLTVSGGTIENLFGGSRGYQGGISADIKQFPATIPSEAEDKGLHDYMTAHPGLEGKGGNINLYIEGGTIGNVFGGCDVNGNVEGLISVTVFDAENLSCPLFIGNVYGANNWTSHTPNDPDMTTPKVMILHGQIGGSDYNLPVNNINGTVPNVYEGNVFGGGYMGNVSAHPKVIIGDGTTNSVTIGGDVFGGGNHGDIDGSPQVIIVPKTHPLTITTPPTGCVVRVRNSSVGTISSGDEVGEDLNLQLVAIPSVGYRFTGWTYTGTGASIANANASATSFTMGTTEASVTAHFQATTPHILTLTSPTGGTYTVKDAQGNLVSNGASIGEGAVLTLVATPSAYGNQFTSWSVTSGTLANAGSAVTTFTMGTSDATLTATFGPIDTHTLSYSTPSGGSFTVKDAQGTPIGSGTSIGEGAVLTLEANTNSGYVFGGWTATGAGSSFLESSEETTTFTMGTEDATLQATFVQAHTLTITPPEHGYLKVFDALGHTVTTGAAVGVGSVLSIKAIPAAGYTFSAWSATNGTIADPGAPVTTFTMGTDNATLTVTFDAEP